MVLSQVREWTEYNIEFKIDLKWIQYVQPVVPSFDYTKSVGIDPN